MALSGIQAYQQANQKFAQQAEALANSSSPSFASFIEEGIQKTKASITEAEALTKQLSSETPTDLLKLVSTLSEAEVNLQMGLAVRDKLIGVYNEIIKTNI